MGHRRNPKSPVRSARFSSPLSVHKVLHLVFYLSEKHMAHEFKGYRPPLNQVALSVVDLRRTEQWFREGLGFLPAGGSRFMASTPLTARVQGLPKAASTMWWLVGRSGGRQLELFQFRRPIAKLMPADFRPCDIGYTRIGVTVTDFDAALVRLAKLGTVPLSAPIGSPGERRVCVRNPDGVYVEILENQAQLANGDLQQENCPVDIHSVTVSTPDLAASQAFFSQMCGKGPEKIPLHAPEHEALWGLSGAQTRSAVFKAGGVLLEVVQYLSPVGKPWPGGYRICDQGILNIAFDGRNRRDFTAVYERALSVHAKPNCAPIHLPYKPHAGVVYMNDSLGFSTELMWMSAGKDQQDWGFFPLPIEQRPAPDNQQVSGKVRIDATLNSVWSVLNAQHQMSQWIGFDEVRLVREGFLDIHGVGAERYMKGWIGTVVEQVIDVVPKQSIRYRVIQGSPFQDHQGEIRLVPNGAQTDVFWTIRFRAKLPFMGGLLRIFLKSLLHKMLTKGLKPYAEREPRA